MFAQSLYGGGGASGQDTTNAAPGTAKAPAATPGDSKTGAWGNVPVLPGIAISTGMSVPMLVAMGVLAWWLFRQY